MVTNSDTPGLALYLGAIALAAFASGVQMVTIPWLATGYLQLPAQMVGWVQAAQLLPSAMLILWSGAFADRSASYRFLPAAYLAAMFFHSLALLLVLGGWLNLTLLLIYGAALGATFALIQPLRDRLLPQALVAQSETTVQRGVVLASACTYMGQALGVLLAGQMEYIGMAPVFVFQCLGLLLVAMFLKYMRVSPRAGDAVALDAPGRQPTIREGLQYIRRHKLLRHLIRLVGFNGFLNLGVYLVAMPLLVRDVYRQDAAFFSLIQLLFVLGNIVAVLGVLKRGNVSFPGRSLLFCLLYSALVMLALSAHPTATGLLLLIFAWGAIAAVSASMGKALLQQQVDDLYRGRVLSLYFLALMGAAPLGALVCGYVMDRFGALELFQISGALSAGLFLVYLRVPVLWQVESKAQS